jgi:hypothetical protein
MITKMTTEGFVFLAIAIALGMIFSGGSMYGILAGIAMLILVGIGYFTGPVGA